MRNFFTFGNVSSLDHDAWISGWETKTHPARDTETVVVPGRNGTLSLDNGRFQNVPVKYKCYIKGDFEYRYGAFLNALSRLRGYQRLEDTYHPDEYRLGLFVGEITPDLSTHMRDGVFTLEFDCKPQRFLKSGERTEQITVSGTGFFNPTNQDAAPLLRVYGTGTLTIGGETLTVTAADVYTDIDCDIQEAFKGSTNCNANITLTTGGFPVLSPGENTILWTGFSAVDITPRWWTL